MKNNTKQFFEDNANSWIFDAYTNEGYNYPTPRHRLRVLKGFLAQHAEFSKGLDVGCGGGHLSLAMLEQGIHVDAIDMSLPMLNIAKERTQACVGQKASINFHHCSLTDFTLSGYDIVVAMGLIGYLEKDEDFFAFAANKVKKNGYVVVSFRNHLFNLFSISENTKNDCDSGFFKQLYEEQKLILNTVSAEDTKSFLQALLKASQDALSLLENIHELPVEETTPYNSSVKPRQSTPAQAQKSAEKYGFSLEKSIGIHPHLLLPKMNKVMPRGIYNTICDSLIPLEEHPLALLWSSVFIGVFKKI